MKYYLLCIILLFTSTTHAQKYSAKTIFELLDIDSTGCDFTYPQGYDVIAKTDEAVAYDNIDRKTISPYEVSEYEGLVALHFKNNKDKKIPFIKVGTLDSDGLATSIMRRGNHYKLVDANGKVLLSDTFFYIIKDNSRGFNAYKQGRRSFYYNHKGKLVFNQKFDYVQDESDGYYVVANNGKYGVADKSGKLILPAIYSSADVFKTNGKLFFSVEEGNLHYFMEQGKNEKLFSGSYKSSPYVVKDRYWLIDGSLFDMQRRKKLFCNITKPIKVFDKARGLFYITDNDTWMGTVFDADGKIVFDEGITWAGSINDRTGIYGVLVDDSNKKSKTDSKRKRYGLLNIHTLTWEVSRFIPTCSILKNCSCLLMKRGGMAFLIHLERKLLQPENSGIFKEQVCPG